MTAILLLIAICFIAIGTFFSCVAVLGYIRLPDVYTRLHTTGNVGVFGVPSLLIAAVAFRPGIWQYAVVLIFFLLAAGPPTAHAMGSAAYRIGLPLKHAKRNDLADSLSQED